MLAHIPRSKIIWRCPAPDLTKKTKPLGQHREAGNPVQAIVAPQRRSNQLAKENKEEETHGHDENKSEVTKEVSSPTLEERRPQKTQSTQVCLSHRRPIKRDVGTQYEAEIGIVAIEFNSGEITNHTIDIDKQSIDADEIQTTNENIKDEDQLSKIAATKKMTSLCQSRRTGREDTHQTTADSLNTNITHFVSTR